MNDPHAATNEPTLKLELRSRRTLRADGNTVLDVTVRCPVRGSDVPLHECLECERCEGLSVDRSSGDAGVVCRGEDALPRPLSSLSSEPAPDLPGVGAADRTPISEVMTKHVVCVRPDLDTRTLAALFLERGISGAPVVDDGARPIGVVSKTDLVRERYERDESGAATERGSFDGSLDDSLDGSTLEAFGFHTEPAHGTTVADIMMPVAFCLPANESIARAAALMAFEGVHRVPVVGSRGQVVGLLSPLDILGWLAREHGYIVGGYR